MLQQLFLNRISNFSSSEILIIILLEFILIIILWTKISNIKNIVETVVEDFQGDNLARKITFNKIKLLFLKKRMEKFKKEKKYYDLGNLICKNLKTFRKQGSFQSKNQYLLIALLGLIANRHEYYSKQNYSKIGKKICREIVFSNIFRPTRIDVVVAISRWSLSFIFNNEYYYDLPKKIISTWEYIFLVTTYLLSKRKKESIPTYNWELDFILTFEPNIEQISNLTSYNLIEGYTKGTVFSSNPTKALQGFLTLKTYTRLRKGKEASINYLESKYKDWKTLQN